MSRISLSVDILVCSGWAVFFAVLLFFLFFMFLSFHNILYTERQSVGRFRYTMTASPLRLKVKLL